MSIDRPDPQPIPEADTLTIPWPRVAPLGVPLSAAGLKEAWDAVWQPYYRESQSVEDRCIAAVLRAVYDGMHGITGGESR